MYLREPFTKVPVQLGFPDSQTIGLRKGGLGLGLFLRRAISFEGLPSITNTFVIYFLTYLVGSSTTTRCTARWKVSSHLSSLVFLDSSSYYSLVYQTPRLQLYVQHICLMVLMMEDKSESNQCVTALTPTLQCHGYWSG